MYSRALGTFQSTNCLTAMCNVQIVLGDNGALTENTGLWAYAKRKCTPRFLDKGGAGVGVRFWTLMLFRSKICVS